VAMLGGRMSQDHSRGPSQHGGDAASHALSISAGTVMSVAMAVEAISLNGEEQSMLGTSPASKLVVKAAMEAKRAAKEAEEAKVAKVGPGR